MCAIPCREKNHTFHNGPSLPIKANNIFLIIKGCAIVALAPKFDVVITTLTSNSVPLALLALMALRHVWHSSTSGTPACLAPQHVGHLGTSGTSARLGPRHVWHIGTPGTPARLGLRHVWHLGMPGTPARLARLAPIGGSPFSHM